MLIFDASVTQTRKERTAKALDPFLSAGEAIAVCAGSPLQKPGGLDQTYPFLPHPDYFWLTGRRRARGVCVYSKDDGWIEFVDPISTEEKIWEGLTEEADLYAAHSLAQLEPWLIRKNFSKLYFLGQPNSHQLSLESGSKQESVEVQEALNSVRRIKDSAEIALVLSIAQMAARGYARISQEIRPGLSERQIQLNYEYEVLKAGSEKFPYDTIVGSGERSAILHALPTEKILTKDELVLVDAGADKNDYCVDITRVYSTSPPTPKQNDIFQLVLASQTAAIAECKPGVEWLDVHQTAARVIADGLKQMRLLRGELDSILETGAVSVFLPHGIGHMVGHRVRDVGGSALRPHRQCCGVRLRVDLPLQENFMMTVEPGLYFIRNLLNSSTVREKYKDQIDWSAVEPWQDFGGVRLEDDVLITSKGVENLTSFIPKKLFHL